MRIIYSIIILLSIGSSAFAQMAGIVIDEEGNPVSYANIILENSTDGTVSNEDGLFTLEYNTPIKVIVSYIGYDDAKVILTPDQYATIRLTQTIYTMDEVVMVASQEDPAYSIVRSAIKKKPYYRKSIKSYQSDLYIKGIIQLYDAPDKVLGIDVGNMGGAIDTAGQGIVYLSESLSTFYYVYPDKTKEVMRYSKVAESDGSYNGNTIRGSFYNIYKERFQFYSTIINPLADNALSHYKYRLHGVEMDKNGSLINKIEVIPKSLERPLFSGFMYIINDSWKVTNLAFELKGKAIGSDFFDKISIKQKYVDTDDGLPLLFSQHLRLDGGMLGFEIGGDFNYVFTNYVLNPEIEDEISFREIFRMQEDATITNDSLWDKVRPVPLTSTEELEYQRKDSLRKIWKSRTFLDSLDKEGNKFKTSDLIFGYSHNNSYKNVYWDVSSPLFTYQFNAVEGSSLGLKLARTKTDSLLLSYKTWSGSVRYGFLDNKWKGKIAYSFRPKSKSYTKFNIYIEDKYRQIHNYRSIAALPTSITANALVLNKHDIKYFRNQGVGFNIKREIINGFRLSFSSDYAYRTLVKNQTFKSPFWEKESFQSNIFPRLEENDLGDHYSLRSTLSLRIAIFQRYKNYVHERVLIPSQWPYIYINYTQGTPIWKAETDYGLLSLRISDNYLNTRTWGYARYYGLIGSFTHSHNMSFIDAHHFVAGSFIPTGGRQTRYGFMILPQYEYSSYDRFVAVAYEQHFAGFISNRIPHFNKLQCNFVLSTSYLKSDELNGYHEVTVGLEDIGLKNFRILRVDYGWAFDKDGHIKKGFTLRVNLDF